MVSMWKVKNPHLDWFGFEISEAEKPENRLSMATENCMGQLKFHQSCPLIISQITTDNEWFQYGKEYLCIISLSSHTTSWGDTTNIPIVLWGNWVLEKLTWPGPRKVNLAKPIQQMLGTRVILTTSSQSIWWFSFLLLFVIMIFIIFNLHMENWPHFDIQFYEL